MSVLGDVLRRIVEDLQAEQVAYALVGGLAVSVRAEPRFTRDVDLVVAVPDDAAAERLVGSLRARGWRPLTTLEHDAAGRMAAVRLSPPGLPERGMVVDLLFASSGIEPDIVAAADTIEVLGGISVPVARPEHLLALKLLARSDARPQDEVDIRWLAAALDAGGVEQARELVGSIEERGFARGRDLRAALEAALGHA